MKKFLNLMGVLITAFLMCAICSCDGHKVWPSDDGVTKEYVDSAVAQGVENYINPLFSSVEEVLVFRDLTAEGQAIDDEFNMMPEDVLKNVAAVCIKREGHISKRGIVYEYRANSSVYNNLPTQDAAATLKDTVKVNPNSGTSAGGQPYGPDTLPVNETTYTQHDTTIGGKTYKVRTRTEKTYE